MLHVLTTSPTTPIDGNPDWSDPELASSPDAVKLAIKASDSDRTYEILYAHISQRSSGYPAVGTYISLSPGAMNQSNAEELAPLFDALATGLAEPSLYTRAAATNHSWIKTLGASGFRWSDTSDTQDQQVFELFRGWTSDARVRSFTANRVEPTVFLATGSKVKADQYGYLLRALGLKVQLSNLSRRTSEPQVDGAGEFEERILVEEPLKNIARFAAKTRVYPLVLEDTMLFIEHFNKNYDEQPMLPGPDTKRWWQALGARGVLEQMSGSRLRRATYVAQLGVLDSTGRYSSFRAEARGSIALKERTSEVARACVPYTNPFAFHSIFIPEGSTRTYAEMGPGEFRRADYRAACMEKAYPLLVEQATKTADLRLNIDDL